MVLLVYFQNDKITTNCGTLYCVSQTTWNSDSKNYIRGALHKAKLLAINIAHSRQGLIRGQSMSGDYDRSLGKMLRS